ncbi:MAG: Gfo/Idh/MocA family oxidoreductase, partial [Actinomycetota bacterium]
MNIRIAVLGAGNIGTDHATNLATTVSGAEVSVIFDVDGDRANEVAAAVGARAVTSDAEAIGADDVDAVLIASPDRFHAEQVMACFEADKPMLCEKPLAVTEADGLAIV